MNQEIIVERLFQALVTGDRPATRSIIEETREAELAAEQLADGIFWPLLESMHQLLHADQLSKLAHHYAIRQLRSLVDQTQPRYDQRPRRAHRILMCCGGTHLQDLAAQLTADLLEADGYEVLFSGGGIANDEFLEEVGNNQPNTLLVFGSLPDDAENLTQLVHQIRTVGACPEIRIAVGGGVFNRATGLAKAIHADVSAKGPRDLIERLNGGAGDQPVSTKRSTSKRRRTTRAKVA